MVEMGWFDRTRCGRLTKKDMKNVVIPEESLKIKGMDLQTYLKSLRPDS